MENQIMSKFSQTLPSTLSSSFDIIENSPQTVIIGSTFPDVAISNNTTIGSTFSDNVISNNDIERSNSYCENDHHRSTDNECDNYGVPNNTPVHTEMPENYEIKKKQIEMNIQILRGSKTSSARSEIRAMKRHLDKLEESMKNKVDFAEFRLKTAEKYKTDKNVNLILKRMYLSN
jgi:hypothetical protein